MKKNSFPVRSKKDICNVGTISANSDREVGKILSDLLEKVGNDGTITIQDGNKLEHEINIVEGM